MSSAEAIQCQRCTVPWVRLFLLRYRIFFCKGVVGYGRCCHRAFPATAHGALCPFAASKPKQTPPSFFSSPPSRNTVAAFWLRKHRATLDSCYRLPAMRYDNWDIILFPEDSNIPIQEYRTACYLSRDEGIYLSLFMRSSDMQVDEAFA